MASNCPLAEQHLMCPVCMDLFNNPVTIPCGHSFCRTCITGYWNSLSTSYKICPMCREVLGCHIVSINFVLRDIVESFKKTSTDDAKVPDESVTCDQCSGESRPRAVTFCLVCLVSYCGEHQESHGTRFPEHKLVDPVTNRLCRVHRKRLERYCKKDKTVLCEVCVSASHCGAGHEVMHISQAYVEEKHELERLVWKEESQHGPMEQIRALMAEMGRTLSLRCRALDNELAALTTTVCQLEELLSLNDPCYFLQNLASIDVAFEVTTQDCPARLTKLSATFLKELAKATKPFSFLANWDAVKLVAISVTLDPTTAHPALIISGKTRNRIRIATHKRNDVYVARQHRFTLQACVLGTRPLLSDAYWEVTIDYFNDRTQRRASSWYVGVATESAMAAPPCDTSLHRSDCLWVLTCKEGQLCVHGKPLQGGSLRQTWLVGVRYSRLERSVSFYDPACGAHLHTVRNVRPRARLFPVFCPDLGMNAFSAGITITPP